MSDFADLRDGGRALGPHVVAAMAGVSEPLLLACIPNGVPVALGIRETFDAPVRALPVERSDAGAVVAPVADLAGRNVIVVDDGVAVVRPFVHRSLAGHYATFDTIDETEAYRLLDSLRPS